MEPTFAELLTSPFRGVSLAPRLVAGTPWRPLLAVVLATAVCGVLIGGLWGAKLGRQARALEDTGIRLMPPFEVRDGRGALRGDPRTVDAGSFLLVLDDTVHPLPGLPGDPGDTRDVVHAAEHAVVVYRRGTKEVFPMAWGSIEGVYGPQVFDGVSLVPFLLRVRRDVVLLATAFGGAVALLWQLLVLLGLAAVHRAVSFRGPATPRFGGMLAVVASGGLPAAVAGGVVLLVGGSQASAVGVHLAVVFVWTLAAVTTLRADQPASD